MAEHEVLMVPSGMLRISKDGEADRLIYPVHADGWRQLGWTVHPPAMELEDEEPEALGVDGSPLPVGIEPDPEGEGGGETDGEGEGEGEGGEPGAEPLDLDGMTKAQIVAAVQERYGVNLDTSATRAELIEQAQQLEAGAAAGGAAVADVAEDQAGGEEVVPELML